MKKLIKKTCIVSILFLIFMVSCNKEKDPENEPNPISLETNLEPLKIDMNFEPSLIKATSCDNLTKSFQNELKRYAIREYKRQIQNELYYSKMGYGSGTVTLASASPEAASSSDTASTTDTSTPEYSETNVQEAGVDEGDIVKTDGSYLYLARSNKLFIVDIQNPLQSKIIATIDETENIDEIYLYQENGKQRLILISTYWQEKESSASYGSVLTIEQWFSSHYEDKTELTFYDIQDKSSPKKVAEYLLPGDLKGSRRVDSNLYVVHSQYSSLFYPSYIFEFLEQYLEKYGERVKEFSKIENLFQLALLALEEDSKRIENIIIEDYFPKYQKKLYKDTVLISEEEKIIADCDDFYFPKSGNGNHLSMVSMINLGSEQLEKESTGIMAQSGQIYMSLDNLYLASTNHWMWIMPMELLDGDLDLENPEPKTGLFKFSIAGGVAPVYKGSGVVNGWINDQFSMSDYNGYLRVGTTRGGWWGESIFNELSIMEEVNGTLQVVGQITDIAQGERIYSMRFDKDRGFMVTFRRTDPLYTMDLSDPKNPVILGELKITGFSTYMHIIGKERNTLLTIGRETDESGRVTGNKLQIIDVSNMQIPFVVASYDLGSVWSDAVFDHHAFLYYAKFDMLAIPYASYSNSTYTSGVKVFNVTDTSLFHSSDIPHGNEDSYWSSAMDEVDRSVIIGNNIFSVGNKSVHITNAFTFEPIKIIEIPQ